MWNKELPAKPRQIVLHLGFFSVKPNWEWEGKGEIPLEKQTNEEVGGLCGDFLEAREFPLLFLHKAFLTEAILPQMSLGHQECKGRKPSSTRKVCHKRNIFIQLFWKLLKQSSVYALLHVQETCKHSFLKEQNQKFPSFENWVFCVGGGSPPLLAEILGHTILRLLHMNEIHLSQGPTVLQPQFAEKYLELPHMLAKTNMATSSNSRVVESTWIPAPW